MRLERSELATPASNWRMIEKAVASAADVAFLDLEDAVAPDQKPAARANVDVVVTVVRREEGVTTNYIVTDERQRGEPARKGETR